MNASTELAALELIDRLLAQLKDFKIPVNFDMDLSKAFDSLSHDIFKNKLTYYGVKNLANDLPRSYLSNRKQYNLIKLRERSHSFAGFSNYITQYLIDKYSDKKICDVPDCFACK